MWQAIENLLSGKNAGEILIFCAFIAVLVWFFSKSGLLQVYTDSIHIGAADREREIIRQQIDWVKLHYEGFENSIEKPPNYDRWLGRYIAERFIDEAINWIILNHITDTPTYIEVKQDKVVNLLRKYAYKPEFTSKEFEDAIREDVKVVVKKLVKIRKVYTKGGY